MWSDGLFEEQIVAAKHLGTHARLLAGPGTGKTRVITKRIEYLISERGIEPSRILALTFTRAAAFELRSRVIKSVGEDNIPKISTLHSFALTQLLRNQKIVDQLPKPLRIADDWEESNIIYDDLKKILGLSKKREIEDLFNQISANWESLTNDEMHQNLADPRFLGAWMSHRKIFGYTMRAELVYQLKKSLDYYHDFTLDPEIDYLIVDEYQDLNLCDLSIIKSIEKKGVELFIAGDDDQSIYGFRKAHPIGIRNFPDEFNDVKTLYLEKCVRCDPEILMLGEFVASQDVDREKKSITSINSEGNGKVVLLNFPNQYIEADDISRICEELISKKSIPPDEILILSRSNNKSVFSNVLEEAMNRRSLPFAKSSSEDSPLNTKQGRQIVSILRLLRNGKDHLAWRTILSDRDNNIGVGRIEKVLSIALANEIGLYDAIVKFKNEDQEDSYSVKLFDEELKKIGEMLAELKAVSEENENKIIPLDMWLTKYIEDYLNDSTIANEISIYLNTIFDIKNECSINDCLHAIETSNGNIEQELVPGKINFLTMHKAKGLSADAVFIVACENEYIPGDKTTKNEKDDERRLLYVSITRARHYLFLSYCVQRLREQKYTGSTSGITARHLSDFLIHYEFNVISKEGEFIL